MKIAKVFLVIMAVTLILSCPNSTTPTETDNFYGQILWNDLPAANLRIELLVDNQVVDKTITDNNGKYSFYIAQEDREKQLTLGLENEGYLNQSLWINSFLDEDLYIHNIEKDDIKSYQLAASLDNSKYTANLKWDNYTHASKYEISYNVFASMEDPVYIKDISENTLEIENLEPATEYIFDLTAYNSNGTEIAYTYWHLTTPAIADEVNNFTGKILWNYKGVSDFHVTIRDESGNFLGSQYTDENGSYNIQCANLTHGKEYYIYLPENNAPYHWDNYALEYSGTEIYYDFHIKKNDVNFISPTNEFVTTPVDIEWEKYTDTTRKQVTLTDVTDPYNHIEVFRDEDYSGTKYTTNQLESGKKYCFRIWVYNGNIEIAQTPIYFTVE